MTGERLKGNLDLLLLAVLVASPAHGYEVAVRLRRDSAGAFDLPEGTIYPALHRLEKRGWLTSDWADVAGKRRRVYAVTVAGRQELVTQRRAWAGFAAGMQAVLGGGAA